LRHKVSTGGLDQVLEYALDALIRERMKSKYALLDHEPSGPKAAAAQALALRGPQQGSNRRSRHIPAAIRRAVLARDGERCSYVDSHGGRCSATSGLEFHHVVPFGQGGKHLVSNIQLVCRGHNDHAAENDYGKTWMESCKQHGRKLPSEVKSPRAVYMKDPQVAESSCRRQKERPWRKRRRTDESKTPRLETPAAYLRQARAV